jgi:hypothetical protein
MSEQRSGLFALGEGKQALLPAQEALLRSTTRVRAIFGGWGSGKTRAAALAFLANCFANPWTKVYGEKIGPTSVVVGLTHKVLTDSSYRELMSILPGAAIRQEWRSPDWKILLENGHTIVLRTAGGSLEGITACGLWLDEAHRLKSAASWLNYQMRVRDPKGQRFLSLVSGLPENGWLSDTFANRENDADRTVIFARTADNKYLPKHVIKNYRSSCSRRDAIKYLEGRWIPLDGAVYHEWEPTLHIVDDPGNREQWCHLSIDVGNQAAVLWWQARVRKIRCDGKVTTEIGWHVVDELLPENMSVDQFSREIKKRGWIISDAHSTIFVDPTVDRDELASLADNFPGVEIISAKSRKAEARSVEYGIRCVNAGLRDADDNVRITVGSHLERGPKNLITGIPKYHRNPRTNEPVKDNTTDHALDAFRYLPAVLLPQQGPGFEVIRRPA